MNLEMVALNHKPVGGLHFVQQEFDKAIEIAHEKLSEEMVTGKGKATWINEEGAEILKEALYIPEIVPKHYKVKILKECPNRCYNWGHSKEIGKRVPVLIPRKFWGQLVGKSVTVECISDLVRCM